LPSDGLRTCWFENCVLPLRLEHSNCCENIDSKHHFALERIASRLGQARFCTPRSLRRATDKKRSAVPFFEVNTLKAPSLHAHEAGKLANTDPTGSAFWIQKEGHLGELMPAPMEVVGAASLGQGRPGEHFRPVKREHITRTRLPFGQSRFVHNSERA
jgi:hypothetical protein